MIYLILYDITSTSLRTKVSKLLEKEGAERIQFSIFVTHFNPYNSGLWKKLKTILKDKNEKLFIIPILKRNFYNTKIIGTLDKDMEYLTGDLNSLTI